MNRRDGLRLITAAALASVPGCASMRLAEGGVYKIPGSAIDRLRRSGARGYACWQDGGLIAGSGNNPVVPTVSVTKSIAALTTARAVTKGWIKPDEVVDFPEWRGQGRPEITLRHLLNSSAGFPPGDRELYSARPADKGRAALRLPVLRTPGSVFRYGPATWEVLAEFVKRRLSEHGTTLERFLGETIGELGIRPRYWRRDGNGTAYFSTGMECVLSELGGLGSALAGLASGHSRLGVSAGVFRNLTAPRAANPMFSAGVWWNRLASMPGARAVDIERSLDGERSPGFWRNSCLQPAARANWCALVGSGGTRVYVLPSASVVIAVALGGNRWSDAAMLEALSA